MNIEVTKQVITNSDYFFMIDNQVRPAMMKIETEKFLPLAKKFLEKCNVTISELKEYPIEGYYYETKELSLYSKILRNLQHNKDVIAKFVDCEELEKLKNICNNDLFGLEDPAGRGGEGPIKRRYDILTRTMESMEIFPDQFFVPRPWSIDRIMDGLSTQFGNRANLVELAYLTGDPKCLCSGAESNSAYRMFACITGSYAISASYKPVEYVWEVTPEVEDLGKRIVVEYNKFLNNESIVTPTVKNVWRWNLKPKVPRVALLGYVKATNEYYHWILDERFQLSEVYSPNIITTQTYEEGVKKKGYLKQLPVDGEWHLYGTSYTGNVFNATPAHTIEEYISASTSH